MRVVVYPHSMEIGGSQLNAVELAAAATAQGHEVLVYSEPGPLVDRVHALGLEHVVRREARLRPGWETAADLRRLVRSRRIDVVHGYEWPPILEAYAATRGGIGRSTAVGTVMSMSVAPFLPSSLPLVVGTAQIRDHVRASHSGPVHLLEPPVDARENAPGVCPEPPVDVVGLEPGALRIVVVSRLVRELKLEGVLTAVRAVQELAAEQVVQLVVVGGGPELGTVRRAAASANAAAGRTVVLVPGESPDPRWAYGSADVCIGMGGSALRCLAFGKPLVVQGEGGFFELLTPETCPTFLAQGWYGRGSLDPERAVEHLCCVLRRLRDPGLRADLGAFGRELVVSRFALDAAAGLQEAVYRDALDRRASAPRVLSDTTRSGAGLISYKVRRRVERHRGRVAVDDFNARPL
ncbi:glycosyltransferase [Nocardioides sp. JQ2195]|uniref:glycosyltransferase n=1 Tax=Nocardioides sp. JQ2195 TaxID=2592334 RepID=UPI00143E2A95|nr:glycosyltransferase [Nocardioides sp. JQ2195]QIX27859.1 glycosyltransferase [Nocardioides sp. JQ2195]